MSDIKRFYVRDGFVLDEHPTGQVVRYSHHMARIEKLEAKIERLTTFLSESCGLTIEEVAEVVTMSEGGE